MTVRIKAFGQDLQLDAPASEALRADALWRLRTHYQPALAARSLAVSGVALDIGAGFGAFALPFALAHPWWTVFAFEPDPESFAALQANVAALGAVNLVAIPAAVAEAALTEETTEALLSALGDATAGDRDAPLRLAALLPGAPFARHRSDAHFLQSGPPPSEDFLPETHPVFPIALLALLEPQLLKLTAPQVEDAVFQALRAAPLDHILGESWRHVDSTLAAGADRPGRREAWMPRAGTAQLALRNRPGPHRAGLDVVVALYNQRNYIYECIAGILANDAAPVRVLVVDDGSTDDSAACVRVDFGSHPRVQLIQKPNGGCASARNFGRMMSDASHIAFVDADDLPDPGLFPDLYELARQTGAEVAQAGFHLLEDGPQGRIRTPSAESVDPMVTLALRHPMGERSCHLVPAPLLMAGQPTIWRRVYRRDYLDNRRIWFPEHIRAFDDQIFQFLTLQPLAHIPMLDGPTYGYRQHPGQDIRQKDERHFYSLEMFRMTLRRGLSEGWRDFQPLLRAFVNTVNWVTGDLRADLVAPFARGAAEWWVLAGKVLGPRAFEGLASADFAHPALPGLCAEVAARLADLPPGGAYAYLDSTDWHVPLVRAPWGQD